MAHKKASARPRATWSGYYTRKTKSKKEKIKNIEEKYKRYLTNH